MLRLTGVVFVLWSVAATAGPSGRVVRIERARGSSSVAPRLCEIHGDTGTCVGDEPRPGQTLVVLDEQHVVAEVQVVEVSSFAATCVNLWTVKTRALRGAATEGIGLIDSTLNLARAHVLDKAHLPPTNPSGVSGEEVWRAIDRDGDGAADILVTRYTCDTSGKPAAAGSTYCVDLWARIGARMVRTTQLNFSQCNL